MWNKDKRFPGWEFYYKDNVLHGRNKDLALSGTALLPDSHSKFFKSDLDNKKAYLVECATADVELWLMNGD